MTARNAPANWWGVIWLSTAAFWLGLIMICFTSHWGMGLTLSIAGCLAFISMFLSAATDGSRPH